jgi:hypothetical protein
MLLFGFVTLAPKAFLDFRAGKTGKGVLSVLLAGSALFFSLMAFYYAYLFIRK